jgi:hypothetical protein
MSSTQWANIGEDAGAPYALLARLEEHVPVALMDQLWIFPPRRITAGESTVVVVGAFDDEDRRRVITARFTVVRNRRGEASVSASFDEHGAALNVAIPRIIQGVLRRLGEDISAEPQHVTIGGQQRQWHALLTELGGRPLPVLPLHDNDTGGSADNDTGGSADHDTGGSDTGGSDTGGSADHDTGGSDTGGSADNDPGGSDTGGSAGSDTGGTSMATDPGDAADAGAVADHHDR